MAQFQIFSPTDSKKAGDQEDDPIRTGNDGEKYLFVQNRCFVVVLFDTLSNKTQKRECSNAIHFYQVNVSVSVINQLQRFRLKGNDLCIVITGLQRDETAPSWHLSTFQLRFFTRFQVVHFEFDVCLHPIVVVEFGVFLFKVSFVQPSVFGNFTNIVSSSETIAEKA